MAKQMTPLPDAKSVRVNPSPAELRELAAKMPNARETRYGNLNVQTEVLARSKASTFIVLDDPEGSSQQAISREEGERIAALQDEYIAGRDMVVVDGFIGDDSDFRTAARLYIEVPPSVADAHERDPDPSLQHLVPGGVERDVGARLCGRAVARHRRGIGQREIPGRCRPGREGLT